MKPELNLQALFNLSYGLFIVTSHSEGKYNGQLSNTVFQVEDEPPRIALSVSKKNLTHEYISKSGVLAVSVLDESTPMKFIGLFGFRSGRDIDKLSEVSFKVGLTGCPVVTENALSVLEAKVVRRLDAGRHTLFVAEVIAAEVLRKGKPLTYAFYRENMRGKTPRNAPTYSLRTQEG